MSRRAPELAKHDVEAKLILLRIGLTSISFINQKIERALTSYSYSALIICLTVVGVVQ